MVQIKIKQNIFQENILPALKPLSTALYIMDLLIERESNPQFQKERHRVNTQTAELTVMDTVKESNLRNSQN